MQTLIVQILADWLVVAVVMVGVAGIVFVPKGQRYQAITKALMTGLTALLLAKIGSLFYQGQRPFEALGLAPGASYLNNPGFPSDHVLLVATITLVVWASTKNKRLAVVLLGLSLLVAIGRVAALVHSPADVIGAALFASLAALLIYGRNLFKPQAL